MLSTGDGEVLAPALPPSVGGIDCSVTGWWEGPGILVVGTASIGAREDTSSSGHIPV